MDEMKITSKFTTGLVSKLLTSLVRKKLGYDICIELNNVSMKVVNDLVSLHVDADVEVEQEVLTDILLKGEL